MKKDNQTIEDLFEEAEKGIQNARILNKIQIACAVMAIAVWPLAIVYWGTIDKIHSFKYQKLEQQARQIADTNNDGTLDDKEREQWKREMGLEIYTTPSDLSLKRYIEANR